MNINNQSVWLYCTHTSLRELLYVFTFLKLTAQQTFTFLKLFVSHSSANITSIRKLTKEGKSVMILIKSYITAALQYSKTSAPISQELVFHVACSENENRKFLEDYLSTPQYRSAVYQIWTVILSTFLTLFTSVKSLVVFMLPQNMKNTRINKGRKGHIYC